MRVSSDHILTSHVGSLPRPDDLIEANRAREAGETTDEPAFQGKLQAAVCDVVRHQRELGIDIPGDGDRVNYGAWLSYCFHRLGGLDLTGPDMRDMPPKRSRPGEVVLTSFPIGGIGCGSRQRTRIPIPESRPGRGLRAGRFVSVRLPIPAMRRSRPTSLISGRDWRPPVSPKAL